MQAGSIVPRSPLSVTERARQRGKPNLYITLCCRPGRQAVSKCQVHTFYDLQQYVLLEWMMTLTAASISVRQCDVNGTNSLYYVTKRLYEHSKVPNLFMLNKTPCHSQLTRSNVIYTFCQLTSFYSCSRTLYSLVSVYLLNINHFQTI